MSLPSKTEKFIWGAYHFTIERWTSSTQTDTNIRIGISPLGDHHHTSLVWMHDGFVETQELPNAPSFFLEAARQWVKSDYKSDMSLEKFLMEMFP